MQYKLQLQTLKKGTLSMKDFLSKMKHNIDLLAASGHPVSDEDQILCVLEGVGAEYNSVVVHVTSRVDFISLSEVSSLLLAHEGRIEVLTPINGSISPSVHMVATNPSKKFDNQRLHSPHFSSWSWPWQELSWWLTFLAT